MRPSPAKTSFIFALLALVFCSAGNAQFFADKQPELLPEEQAFMVDAEIEQGRVKVTWLAAPDYYIYRDKLSVSSSTAGVEIGALVFPQGQFEDDPLFGKVEVYFDTLDLSAPISAPAATQSIDLVLKSQGCNKPVGVCYAPQTRQITVAYQGATNANNEPTASLTRSAQDAAKQARDNGFWAYVLAAFGAGILLSFTPCVLPMIPILAGVIAGQTQPSKARSGWLASCYVAGTIVTYALAGWLAGRSGTQLQAYFQNPWVIGFICILLIALAASLFGAFRLQLPSAMQSKLSATSVNSRSASVSSFALGLISALVVGACVSPVLIVTLGAAIAQGDPVLGMAIMSSMALGMGLLLIAFGFGAGWLLPKTGAWMNEIQIIFAFMVLGVAIYIASGIASVPSLYLWAALLVVAGSYLWQLASALIGPLNKAFIRGVAILSIIWGGMALVGGATQGDDILRPLSSLSAVNNSVQTRLDFQRITSLTEAQALLGEAQARQQKTLVDFYADWCLDCKRMHRSTYIDPRVVSALGDWQLIEIDVTETSDASQQVKAFFDVFGPPATLFIQANGEEVSELRRYGYMDSDEFLSIVSQVGN